MKRGRRDDRSRRPRRLKGGFGRFRVVASELSELIELCEQNVQVAADGAIRMVPLGVEYCFCGHQSVHLGKKVGIAYISLEEGDWDQRVEDGAIGVFGLEFPAVHKVLDAMPHGVNARCAIVV